MSEHAPVNWVLLWSHCLIAVLIFFLFTDWSEDHCPRPDKGAEIIVDFGISLMWEASIPAASIAGVFSTHKSECTR